MKQQEFILQETIIHYYYEIDIESEKHLGKMLRSQEVEGQNWRSRDQKQRQGLPRGPNLHMSGKEYPPPNSCTWLFI